MNINTDTINNDDSVSNSHFFEGEKFPNWESLKAKIQRYEKTMFTGTWIRDSRTVASARIKKTINPALKYYELRIACVHGGRSFKTTSKGMRTSSTFKKNCPFDVSFRASSCGNFLEVKSLTNEHNHELSQSLFNHLPSQRRITASMKAEAKQLLSMKVNKKMLQQMLAKNSGKQVTLKDISNMSQQVKNTSTRNSLETVCSILQTEHGCSVRIYADQQDLFQGLFFQDGRMKRMYSSFPEIIFIDATYKVTELRLPVYVLMIEDAFGESEVVGVAFVANESAETLRWILETFKNENQNISPRVIMADKDITERKVFKEVFPTSNTLICLFHSLRSFRRELCNQKLKLSESVQTLLKEQFQKICYSSCEEEYEKNFDVFMSISPPIIQKYYLQNWHDIRNEWVLGKTFQTGNYLNSTNNRVESFNSKLKEIVDHHSSLESFVNGFFVLLYALRNERNAKCALNFQKVPVTIYDENQPEHHYIKFLTRYASNLVIHQIQKKNSVNNLKKTAIGDYEIRSNSRIIKATLDYCTCGFFNSMQLPCRHIFALRELEGKPLFDENLCNQRWTSKYCRKNTPLFNMLSEASISPVPVVHVCQSKSKVEKPLTHNEKFRKSQQVCLRLATLAAEVSAGHFGKRIQLLQEIVSLWEANEHCRVISIKKEGIEEEVELSTRNLSIEERSSNPLFKIENENISNNKETGTEEEVNGLEKRLGINAPTNNVFFENEDANIICSNGEPSTKEIVNDLTKSNGIKEGASNVILENEDANICNNKETSSIEVVNGLAKNLSMEEASKADIIKNEGANIFSYNKETGTEEVVNGLEKSLGMKAPANNVFFKNKDASIICNNNETGTEEVVNGLENSLGVKAPANNVFFKNKDASIICNNNETVTEEAINGTTKSKDIKVPANVFFKNEDANVICNNNETGTKEVVKKSVKSVGIENATINVVLENKDAKLICDSKETAIHLSLSNIKMPQKIYKRGRPKGFNSSVIGLPSKKKKKPSQTKLPFKKSSSTDCQSQILTWLVGEKKAKLALGKKVLLSQKDLLEFSKISMKILDDNVIISLVKQFFKVTAWKKVVETCNRKRKLGQWKCKLCNEDSGGYTIACQWCLECFHLQCVGLKQKPKIADWKCRVCSLGDAKIEDSSNTEGKSYENIELYPGRETWDHRSQFVYGDPPAHDVKLTPLDAPFALYFDDLKTLYPKSLILGQVIDALFLVLSAEAYKKGIPVYILPESFFSRVNNDISLEKAIPGDCSDIRFIAAASFHKRHWSLVLLDCQKKLIYYLDPLFNYVENERIKRDIAVVNRIIWFNIMNCPLTSNVPDIIDGWSIITSENFSNFHDYKLPRQFNGHDCGLFVVMYFFYIIYNQKIDFYPGDMAVIRRWAYNVIIKCSNNTATSQFVSWIMQKMESNRLGGLKLKVHESNSKQAKPSGNLCKDSTVPNVNSKKINLEKIDTNNESANNPQVSNKAKKSGKSMKRVISKKKTPKRFADLPLTAKQEVIMSWLTGRYCAKEFFETCTNRRICVDEIEGRPSWVCDGILKAKDCLLSMEEFFSSEAWELVQRIITFKELNSVTRCVYCHDPIYGNHAYCQGCLNKYHSSCITKCFSNDQYCKLCNCSSQNGMHKSDHVFKKSFDKEVCPVSGVPIQVALPTTYTDVCDEMEVISKDCLIAFIKNNVDRIQSFINLEQTRIDSKRYTFNVVGLDERQIVNLDSGEGSNEIVTNQIKTLFDYPSEFTFRVNFWFLIEHFVITQFREHLDRVQVSPRFKLSDLRSINESDINYVLLREFVREDSLDILLDTRKTIKREDVLLKPIRDICLQQPFNYVLFELSFKFEEQEVFDMCRDYYKESQVTIQNCAVCRTDISVNTRECFFCFFKFHVDCVVTENASWVCRACGEKNILI